MASKTRPPVGPQLRNAGESLRDRLMDVVTEDAVPWFIAAAIVVLLAALEWVRVLLDLEPQPIVWSALAVLVTCIASLRIWHAKAAVRRIKLAIAGESSVAESLQELASKGWRIYHDIPADGFNIDHVAVGPNGVLAIETKTRSKPMDHGAQIVVSEKGVSIDGRLWDTADVSQAQRQADWLRKYLRKTTARGFFVRPVLLFPGWYVKERRRTKETWVLNPGRIGNWLRYEHVRLSNEDIALAASRIDHLVRGQM